MFPITVLGYVVNVYSALNYDIHLDLPSSFPTEGMEMCTYTYTEDSAHIETGMTCRCRLVGILRRKTVSNYEEYHASTRMVTQRLNRLNSWVLVRVYGFDKYHRLLVELIDFISGVSINSELKMQQHLYMEYN